MPSGRNREIADLLDLFEGQLTAQSLALYITIWAVAGSDKEVAASIKRYLDLMLDKLSAAAPDSALGRLDVKAELALVRAALGVHLETLSRQKQSRK